MVLVQCFFVFFVVLLCMLILCHLELILDYTLYQVFIITIIINRISFLVALMNWVSLMNVIPL